MKKVEGLRIIYKDKMNEGDIIEELYDIMVLKPSNELELYRKYLKKLLKIHGYKTPLIK